MVNYMSKKNLNKISYRHKKCIKTNICPVCSLGVHVYYFSTDLKSTDKVRGQRTVSLTFWDGSGQGEVARAGSGRDVFGWGLGLG